MMQLTPHLFATQREAVAALNAYVMAWSNYLNYEVAYVMAWSNYLNYEVAAVMGEDVAFTGYHVRVKSYDGDMIAYIAPVENNA